MPDLSPEIELILRAGEVCRAWPGWEPAALRQAVDAVADRALPPGLAAVRNTAIKLLEAPGPARAGWLEALSGHLRDLDACPRAGQRPDPGDVRPGSASAEASADKRAAVESWKRWADL